jgi:hypothetical protein
MLDLRFPQSSTETEGVTQRRIPVRQPVFVILLAAALGLTTSPALAQKTDVVYMDNGNVIIGEVKKLERGLLEFSVDDVKGRLRIEWEHVVRLTSDQQLDIDVGLGRFYLGSLIESSADGKLCIKTGAAELEVELVDVVLIAPIKDSFWKRLEADVTAGFSFTKASDIVQFNLGGSATYRTVKAFSNISLNTIITSKADSGEKTNSDLRASHLRFFKRKWFYLGSAGANRNDEQGIDFRGNLAGGAGRRLLHSNRSILLVSASLSANREYTSDGRKTNNLELAVGTNALAFRHDTPKLEMRSDLTVFVNLTTQGRYRVDYDGLASIELVIEDLFWDISQVYYRFDSDPSATAASRHDYGFVTGLRYKF